MNPPALSLPACPIQTQGSAPTTAPPPAQQPVYPPGHTQSFRILTQNVNGFRHDSVRAWMSSWKSHLAHARLDVICIQETHVGSAARAAALTQQWNQCWGLRTPSHPTSFWSTASSTSAGVAILLNPYTETTFHLDPDYNLPGRFLQIHSTNLAVAVVYAPSAAASDRTTFFSSLNNLPRPRSHMIIAGDFNCVTSPALDRSEAVSSRKDTVENRALEIWLESWHLSDSLWQTCPSPRSAQALQAFRKQHHTCHRPQSGSTSRLDRLYISPGLRELVRQHQVVLPGQRSDHDAVLLTLAPRQLRVRACRQRLYPFRTTHPMSVRHKILAYLKAAATLPPDRPTIGRHWDQFSRHLQQFLRQLQRSEAVPPPPPRPNDNPGARLAHIDAYADQLAEIDQYRFGRAILEGTRPDGAFFRRFSTRWDDSGLPHIDPPAQFPADTSENNMANGWRPTLTSKHKTVAAGCDHIRQHHVSFLRAISGRLQPGQADYLLQPCTQAEYTSALQRLHSAKAPGPDGVSNGFYKDFQEALAPLLICLFDALLQGHPPPSSFNEADILPLKKNGNSAKALDYRPIALLNSAYKIFAQILAHRLQPLLAHVIGQQQQGFVPGRTLDDSIGLFQRALKLQSPDPQVALPDSAAVICLDIKKAYDSMERAHLLCTLRAMGFPVAFVSLIARLHSQTTVRFVVNGVRSAEVQQTSGIRQGCPLAPFLFILGMEPLLATLHAAAAQHGLLIPAGPLDLPLLCNAHVDDTAVFLRSLRSLPWVLAQLEAFGDMSGLRVQRQKSFGICLNGAHSPPQLHGIPFLAASERRRYLGIQVGLGSLTEANWDQCHRSTLARLRMASMKTHHKPARALVLRAIVQAKFSFLATFVPPTEKWIVTFERLILNFWWQGSTVPTANKLPTYVPRSVLQEPMGQAGWSIPDVRGIARQQAVRRYVRLALHPDTWAHAITLSCLQLPHGTPYVLHPAARPTPLAPITCTLEYGKALASTALTRTLPRVHPEQVASQCFLQAARTEITFTWNRTGRCVCHIPSALQLRARERQMAFASTGPPAWRTMLWHGQLHSNAWLRDHSGKALTPQAFDSFGDAFKTFSVGETWGFEPRRPPLPQHQGQLQYLFLVALSVGLESQPPLTAPSSRIWFPAPPPRVNLRRPAPVAKRISAQILTALRPSPPDLERYALRRTQLCTRVGLLYDPAQWTQDWTSHPLPGALKWFMYRWYLQAFPFRTSATPPRCPFCGEPDGSDHTFWKCPRARSLWSRVLALWFAPAPPPATSDCALEAMVGTQLPPAPWLHGSAYWSHSGVSYDHLGSQAWLLVRALVLRTLWNDRCAALHDNLERVSPPAAFPLLLQTHFRALGSFHQAHRHQQRSALFTALDHQFSTSNVPFIPLLHGPTPLRRPGMVYFDGAARVLEGFGGAGALAFPCGSPLLCTYEAHFIATPTTNNIAEYEGLVRGLRLALHLGLTHVVVIGDSQLLVRHLLGLYRVRHAGLRQLYLQARVLSSHLHCSWIHRTRDKNQAADFLSKRAPDATGDFTNHDRGPGKTPLSPSDLATFLDLLDMDLTHHPG